MKALLLGFLLFTTSCLFAVGPPQPNYYDDFSGGMELWAKRRCLAYNDPHCSYAGVCTAWVLEWCYNPYISNDYRGTRWPVGLQCPQSHYTNMSCTLVWGYDPPVVPDGLYHF